ncbi:MAG: NAD(P)H-hydrate dehydratase [Pseudomonadota bacterium]
MVYLYTASQSQAVDTAASQQIPVPGFELMRRAARYAFDTLLERWPDARSINVWCGKGNNAGDAYLLAQLGHELGLQVRTLAVRDPGELSGDAKRAYLHACEAGVSVEPWVAGDVVPSADVQVDGLLGTGISGPPRAEISAAISEVNAQNGAILSIDLPSGVDGSTGTVPGEAVQAQVVTTFITHKVGSFTGPGLDYCADLCFSDLGVDASAYLRPDVETVNFHQCRSLLAEPGVNAYKHQQGHLVMCGGDLNMPGAIALAARAGLRCGAGMVTCVTHPENRTVIVGQTPEIMVCDVAQLKTRQADVFVLGPGLGRGSWSQSLYESVEQYSAHANTPVVLDADGLHWLAQKGAWRGGPLTITPHVAEAAQLLDGDVPSVQADRVAAARALAKRFGCHGVIKGAGSVVFSAESAEVRICQDGNPGMATAGMGDVLSGMVAAMLGQSARERQSQPGGAQSMDRLCLSVCLHSAAADFALAKIPPLSLMASDVIDAVPGLLQELRD